MATSGSAGWTVLRLAAWAVCCLYIGVILLGMVETGQPWFRSASGDILPRDFLALYVAGHMANAGEAALAYDPTAFAAAQAQWLADGVVSGLRWLNPPILLLPLGALARLPYDAAFIGWLLATGIAYAAAMRAALGRPGAIALGFAAPATISCVVNGQNGFLSAALLGGGLALVDRRPLLAGALLGALAYKPHLALAIPVVLIAGGAWRALCAAAASAAGLSVLAASVFGIAPWLAFLASIGGTTDRFLGPASERAAMLTTYAAVSALGIPGIAVVAHVAVAAAAIAAAALLWRQAAPLELRAAALIAACFLTTPYAFNHDATLLAVAAAFIGRAALTRVPMRGEWLLLVAAPILPIIGLLSGVTLAGPMAAGLLIVAAHRRWQAMRPGGAGSAAAAAPGTAA